MQLQREHLDQQQPQPEARHRLPRYRDRRDRHIHRPVPPSGTNQPRNHPHHQRHREPGARQHRRGPQPAEHHLERRLVRLQRLAEPPLHQIAEEDEELHRDWLVEVQPRRQLLDLLLRAIDVEENIDRIAGQPQHHERHRRDEDERHGQQQEPSDDDPKHVLSRGGPAQPEALVRCRAEARHLLTDAIQARQPEQEHRRVLLVQDLRHPVIRLQPRISIVGRASLDEQPLILLVGPHRPPAALRVPNIREIGVAQAVPTDHVDRPAPERGLPLQEHAALHHLRPSH